MKKSIVTVLLLLSMLIPLGTVACGTEWESMLLGILEEWSNEHDINPSTLDGAANLARRTASGSTGDEEADAAIDYETIVRNVREAEEKDKERGEESGTDGSQPTGATLSEDPAAHVEGFLAGESGGAGSGDQESTGLSWGEVVDQLSGRVKSPSSVDAESAEEIFEKVKGIVYEEDPETGKFQPTRASGHDVVDVRMQNGETRKVGILVSPEGRILYTPDGKDYYSDLESAVDPSLTQRATELYSDTKDWMWESLFEGSTRNKDIDLQNKVASEVLDDLRTQLDAGEAPKSVADWTEGQLWDKQVKEPLQTKVHELLWQQAEEVLKDKITSGGRIPTPKEIETLELFEDMKYQFDGGKTTTPKAWDEIKKQSGLDLFDLVEVDGLKAGELAVAGAEFALESVKTMGRGLQDTDFALRSRAYIAERNAGQKPELIWQRMRSGELPELDIGSAKAASGGVSSMMASSDVAQEAQLGVMFTMYEQSYQRYLLAKDIGR
ncbi:MAG: hypothetical protein Q8Q07_07245 [Dehalococcoidales bacterium]|nr:hypothetical protein [Dehalococcoidales bacterium]